MKQTEEVKSDSVIQTGADTIRVVNKDSVSILTCDHTNLSKDFNIKVLFKRFHHIDEYYDSCIVTLILTDIKTLKMIDTLSLSSIYFYGSVFDDCENVRSYSTRFNHDKIVVDNQFGDIIVADLNFDKKDDIALIRDSGGNGGTLYSYYIQGEDTKFTLDSFLTDSMAYFPSQINSKKQTLVTNVHASVSSYSENSYHYDHLKGTWMLSKTRLIDFY